jgi:hypothetical protein
MLRRNLTVAFAVSALLLLGWEDPTPDSTLVVDAFQAFADIVEALGDGGRPQARLPAKGRSAPFIPIRKEFGRYL